MAGIRLDKGFLRSPVWRDPDARALFLTMLVYARAADGDFGLVTEIEENLFEIAGLGDDAGELALGRLVTQYQEVEAVEGEGPREHYLIRGFGRFRRYDRSAKARIARYRRRLGRETLSPRDRVIVEKLKNDPVPQVIQGHEIRVPEQVRPGKPKPLAELSGAEWDELLKEVEPPGGSDG